MTNQETQQRASDFTQRSDSAATRLKEAMGLPQKQVQVDANGRPPAPPPPENSYARMAYDEAVAAQARITQAEQAKQPVPEQEPIPEPRDYPAQNVSDKAAERIQELVAKLREKDQTLQQLQASHSQSEAQIAELRQAAEQLRAQQEELLAKRLEELTPEERAAVIGQQQVQEAITAAEQRILQRIAPRLERLDEQALASEYEKLAARYPKGFDPRVHPELIAEFRKSNPRCSVEMAFRAVATDEELSAGRASSAPPVPPSLAPNHSGIPKSVHLQQVSQPASDPAAEIAEEAAAAYKLMRSGDPNERTAGMRAIQDNLAKRLFG